MRMTLWAIAVWGLTAGFVLGAEKPQIKKLGTIECDLVEATPIVFHGRLYRFEYVRTRYKPNTTGRSYFRFIDVATGEPTASFAAGCNLGSAFVDADTAYVYGVRGWGTPTIYMFQSKDLKTWTSGVALQQPKDWKIYNTSVCKADGRYLMAFEVGAPREVVGAAFTNRFAESTDADIRVAHRALPGSCPLADQPAESRPAILAGRQADRQCEAHRRRAQADRRGGEPQQFRLRPVPVRR